MAAFMDPERIPVIVGVGQYNDRPQDPEQGMDPLGLMEKALRLSDQDAGGGWLSAIESLSIVGQISYPELGDITPPLAQKLGASPKYSEITKTMGDSPLRLLSEAANRIGSGDVKVAAVVGGEALRTAHYHATKAMPTEGESSPLERMRRSRPENYHIRHGLRTAVDVYALFENASRAAYGQSLAEGQDETAEMWAQFAEVAKHNPGAWLQNGASAQDIKTISANNRPISHPYSKFMVANPSVNQGAGFLVTSLAEAQRRNVPKEQLIYIGYGASASEDFNPLARDRYDRSMAMDISITKALQINQLSVDELDYVELYSCFPCVPKMARRVLNWPLNKAASVFGGLTYGGGPIANYMTHAVVSMVSKLREQGSAGLLYANGGYATYHHTLFLTTNRIERAVFPQDFNFQKQADNLRGALPLIDEDYQGPATIETFTVTYHRDGSAKLGIIVAKTAEGTRTLANVLETDQATLTFLTDGKIEPVGSEGSIKVINNNRIWTGTE